MKDGIPAKYGIHIGAILLGWLLDFGGQFILQYGTMVLYAFFLGVIRTSNEELTAEWGRFIASTPHLLIILFYEVVFTVAGAQMTAARARSKPVSNAVGMGFLGLITGSALYHFNPASHILPVWYIVLSLVIVVPLAWFGGYRQMKHASKRETLVPPVVSDKPPIPDIPQS